MSTDYLSSNIDVDEEKNSLYLALADAASSTIISQQPAINNKKFKSRFFFKSTKIDTELNDRINQFKPKVLEHIDEIIVNRSSQYLKELPKTLEENIASVREFFLSELSPLTLALSTGSSQASQVITMAIGVDIDPTVNLQFTRMATKAVNIRMSNYIAKYFGLNNSDAEILLQSISPVRKEAVFLGADPTLNGYKKQSLAKPEGD